MIKQVSDFIRLNQHSARDEASMIELLAYLSRGLAFCTLNVCFVLTKHTRHTACAVDLQEQERTLIKSDKPSFAKLGSLQLGFYTLSVDTIGKKCPKYKANMIH